MAIDLQAVLLFKIVVTALLWCGPLLVVPLRVLEQCGFPKGQSAILVQLLGMAYGALLVTYVFGLLAVQRGQQPLGVVWTGIASNGGACLLLSLAAARGAWAGWQAPARLYMWLSLACTGFITAGLLLAGVR